MRSILLLLTIFISVGSEAYTRRPLSYFLYPAREFQQKTEIAFVFPHLNSAVVYGCAQIIGRAQARLEQFVSRPSVLSSEQRSAMLDSIGELDQLLGHLDRQTARQNGALLVWIRLSLIVKYDGFVPRAEELDELTTILDQALKKARKPADVEAIHWNLAVLQQFETIYNTIHPQNPSRQCEVFYDRYRKLTAR